MVPIFFQNWIYDRDIIKFVYMETTYIEQHSAHMKYIKNLLSYRLDFLTDNFSGHYEFYFKTFLTEIRNSFS